jgi:hypothetical protein
MAFIQIIEFTTDNIDAFQAVDEEWLKATEGKRTARREILAKDRNNAGRYYSVVFFDSYESAMENSNLPETQAAAEKYRAASKDVAFYDLDVLSEWSG